MENVKIFEKNLTTEECKMAILVGGLLSPNPKSIMDKAVKQYVGNQPYVEFVDINLDNPWVRVVIKGINKIEYEEYADQKL